MPAVIRFVRGDAIAFEGSAVEVVRALTEAHAGEGRYAVLTERGSGERIFVHPDNVVVVRDLPNDA
jgi:hypothetical protein